MKIHEKVFAALALLAQVAGLVACFETNVQEAAILLTLLCMVVLALFIAYRFKAVRYL